MFKMEVKQETFIEDSVDKESYSSKQETVFLGSYQIESEYTAKSEYSSKRKYQLIDIIVIEEDLVITLSLAQTKNIVFQRRF